MKLRTVLKSTWKGHLKNIQIYYSRPQGSWTNWKIEKNNVRLVFLDTLKTNIFRGKCLIYFWIDLILSWISWTRKRLKKRLGTFCLLVGILTEYSFNKLSFMMSQFGGVCHVKIDHDSDNHIKVLFQQL